MTSRDRNERLIWGTSVPRSWLPSFNQTHQISAIAEEELLRIRLRKRMRNRRYYAPRAGGSSRLHKDIQKELLSYLLLLLLAMGVGVASLRLIVVVAPQLILPTPSHQRP